MSLWRQVSRGLWTLTHRRAADQAIADELRHYYEQLGPDAATVPRVTMAREEARAYGWENVVDQTLADIRYAARRLRASPAFTIVAALTLAVGIGASTAIFSVVYPILFEPLSYPDAGRILMVSDRGTNGNRVDVTFGTYAELAARSRSFSALAVLKPWQPTLTGRAEPERLDGQRVSADYFRALGVAPRLGRNFDAADDQPHGPNQVIVSDAMWHRDTTVLGKTLTLDGDRYTVIGVMPAGFDNALQPSAHIWSLLQYEKSAGFFGTTGNHDAREWGHHLTMIVRVRSELQVETARRELADLARAPAPEFARPYWATLEDGLIVHALQDDVTSAVRPALLAILAAVLLVLAIACVNVTNLLLARGVQRRGELAMRTALGAGRGRIVRQLLIESVLLALLGGALGVVFASAGTRVLVTLSPPELPRMSAIGIAGPVFVYAFGVTTLCGVLIGLVPALRHQRPRLRRTRGALVVAEVGLALVLLVGAGLLLRSLNALLDVPSGFNATHILTMQVQVPSERVVESALEAVRRVPGVTSAAFTSQLPLSGDVDGYGVHLASGDYDALRYTASAGYPPTLGITLRRGRLLDEHDVAGRPRVVLISESFANRIAGDPIGQRLRMGPDTVWSTIVGVVGNVKQISLAADATDAVYTTTSQWIWFDSKQSLVIRARGDAASLTPAIKAAIWSVDTDVPVVQVSTMADLVARSEAKRRFALTVFEAFGIAALLLAAIGLYGVLSGSVTERIREIGLRSALGASPVGITTLIVRQGMTLATLGIIIGLLGALAASRAIASLLFGVTAFDAMTYGGVVAMLLGVSLLACWLPARRASGVAPLTALRTS